MVIIRSSPSLVLAFNSCQLSELGLNNFNYKPANHILIALSKSSFILQQCLLNTSCKLALAGENWDRIGNTSSLLNGTFSIINHILGL